MTDNHTNTEEVPAPPPDGRSRPRRLTRSRDDKVIAGVAGGLGAYFDVDPVVFRIGFVAVTLLGGSGILLYLIGWLVLPTGEDERSVGQDMVRKGATPRTVGVILLLVAILLLAQDAIFWGSGRLTLSLALLAGGAALLWWRPGGDEDERPADAPVSSAAASSGDAQSPESKTERTESTQAPTAPMTPPPVPPPPQAPPAPEPPPRPSRRRPRPRSPLGRITLAIILVLGGLVGLADASEAFDVSIQGFLAVALIVTGLGLIVGAWWGRSRGLILLGVVLTVVVASAASFDLPLRGGFGERLYAPANHTELDRTYRLFAGEMTLDLTGVELRNRVTDITASVGFGEMRVVVPRDVRVIVDAEAHAGEVTVFGQRQEGVGPDVTRAIGPRGQGLVRIDLQVGAGQIEVRRGAA